MNSPIHRNDSSARTAIFAAIRPSRVFAAMALAAAGLLFGGCTTYTPAGNMEMFVRTAPIPSLVPHGKELVADEAHAAQDPSCFALMGSGKSMEPMYVSGTAIVVREQAYATLRVGMPVVYRNSRGYYVAHMLVEEMRGGWIAIGVNNSEPDEELVTQNNFRRSYSGRLCGSRHPVPRRCGGPGCAQGWYRSERQNGLTALTWLPPDGGTDAEDPRVRRVHRARGLFFYR